MAWLLMLSAVSASVVVVWFGGGLPAVVVVFDGVVLVGLWVWV